MNLAKQCRTEHSTWNSMRSRCFNPKCRTYANYGGRGITVCERWNNFANFLSDMGLRPGNLTLDRIDNDGNYEPSNCQWATRERQNANRRNARQVEFRGSTIAFCEAYRISQSTTPLRVVKGRLRIGWDIETALSTPRLEGEELRRRHRLGAAKSHAARQLRSEQ